MCFGISGEDFEKSKSKWIGKYSLDWCMAMINGHICNDDLWKEYG